MSSTLKQRLVEQACGLVEQVEGLVEQGRLGVLVAQAGASCTGGG